MTWALSGTGSVASQNAKTASATYTSGAITAAIGETVLLGLTFDNTGSATPVVNTITVPGGETAVWTLLGFHNSSTATSGSGVRSELWAIKPAAAWTAFTPVVTLSVSVTAKGSFGRVFTGAGPFMRIDGTVTGATSATSAPTTTTALPQSGDLVVGVAGFQTATAPTIDADTTNGSWDAGVTGGPTGGTDNTNVVGLMQYKIVSATGSQTFNPTDATSTASGVVVVVLAVGPTAAQVSRVHTETLVAGTPVAQVSRVHIEALVLIPTFVGDATGAHTQGATADGVLGKVGDATGAHTQAAATTGSTGVAGAATGAHTQGASATGTVASGLVGAATGTHTQGATATGNVATSSDATGAHTQGASATGVVGLSTGATGAHTQGASADGAVSAGFSSGAIGAHTQGATADGSVNRAVFGDVTDALTQGAIAAGVVRLGNGRNGTPLPGDHTQGAFAVGVVGITLPDPTGGVVVGVGTIRWLFYDPLTAVAYEVEINPDSMTSVEPPQKNTRTVRDRGQRTDPDPMYPRTVTVLDKPPSWDWEFSGAIRTESHYLALRGWCQLTYPVRVRDHLMRVFEVYLTDFEPQERPQASRNFWRMRYTVRAKILRRVT